MTRATPILQPAATARRRLLAGAWALAAGAGWPAVQAAPAALGQGVVWPKVQLLDAGPLAAEDLQGQAAIVVFFSTDCPFCQRHNQHVDRLARASAGLPLRVIGAAQDRDAAVVRAYLQRQAYAFAVTLEAPVLRAALSARRVIPLTCVIDRQGLLREVIPGEMFEEDVLGLAKWARS